MKLTTTLTCAFLRGELLQAIAKHLQREIPRHRVYRLVGEYGQRLQRQLCEGAVHQEDECQLLVLLFSSAAVKGGLVTPNSSEEGSTPTSVPLTALLE